MSNTFILAFLLYGLGGIGIYFLYDAYQHNETIVLLLKFAAIVYGIGGLPAIMEILSRNQD